MKTRVIQDEPDEPVAHERPADRRRRASGTTSPSRMARWARRIGKTAIFGCS